MTLPLLCTKKRHRSFQQQRKPALLDQNLLLHLPQLRHRLHKTPALLHRKVSQVCFIFQFNKNSRDAPHCTNLCYSSPSHRVQLTGRERQFNSRSGRGAARIHKSHLQPYLARSLSLMQAAILRLHTTFSPVCKTATTRRHLISDDC